MQGMRHGTRSQSCTGVPMPALSDCCPMTNRMPHLRQSYKIFPVNIWGGSRKACIHMDFNTAPLACGHLTVLRLQPPRPCRPAPAPRRSRCRCPPAPAALQRFGDGACQDPMSAVLRQTSGSPHRQTCLCVLTLSLCLYHSFLCLQHAASKILHPLVLRERKASQQLCCRLQPSVACRP